MDESHIDDESVDEELLRAQLEYDSSVAQDRVSEATREIASAIGTDFAKTVRLLHDVLGTTNNQNELPSATARPSWELPQPFGRFRTIEKLGQGAFGAVWKAYDPILNRYVAIKALHPDLRQIPALHERFEHEAQAAARLNHPNIVRVFEVGSVENICYIVTEFVEGAPLQIFQSGRLAYTPRIAASLIAQLADAIYHSHQQGVLHRDIKPENILIGSPSEDQHGLTPRLTDFGLARLVDQQTRASSAGMLVGSFDYMAPEQLMGLSDRIGPAADIYALGVLLFQLLTGELPRQTNGNIFRAVEASRNLPGLRKNFPMISRDLEAICRKCLAFDLEDRFHSANALRDDLNNYLEDRPTVTRPPSLAESLVRWSRVHRTASLAILLVAGSVLATLFVSLYASYELARRNDELADARDASSVAESLAQEHEARYRDLAWHSGLQLAFGKLERGQLRGLSLALKTLASQHDEAIHRPAWKLLNAELESRYKLLLTESVPLREVVAIPHTTLIAIGGDQSDIIIYDCLTNTVHKRLSTPIEQVHALAASPDGKLLAVGGSTHPDNDQAWPLIIDWSTETFSQLENSGPTTIESLKFSPNGKRLAVGFRYEDVQVVNLETPGAKTIAIPASRRSRAVDWLSENEIVVHRDHASVTITDLLTMQVDTIGLPNQLEAFSVAHTGGWLCTSNALVDGCTLVSISDQSDRRSLSGIHLSSKCIAISPDEKRIAAGTDLGELVIWEFPDDISKQPTSPETAQTPISRRAIMGSGITSITWIGDSIVLVGESGEVVRWSPSNAIEHLETAATTAASFIADDQIALGTELGKVALVDLNAALDQSINPTQVNTSVTPQNARSCSVNGIVALGTDFLLADAACDSGHNFVELKLPDLIEQNSFTTSEAGDRVARVCADLSSDGKWLAWGGTNNRLSVVNRKTNALELTVELTGDIYGLRFLNSRLIGVGGQFEGVRVFDLANKQLVATLGTAHAGGVFVNQSNNTITVGFKDGFLRSWSIETWQPEFALRTNESLIESICENADGSLGVSVDEQSNVVVYNPRQRLVYGRLRENLRTREQFTHTRMTCQFSPDGQKLLLLLVFFKDKQIKSIMQVYDLSFD